jgi:hypothetical protein
MPWTKRGLIFAADGRFPWMASHAQMPVADTIAGDRLRIYFATRDAMNRSFITFLEADAEDPAKVLYVHDRPVLSPGELGCFDDSGTLPSCLVTHAGTKYLYYVGVNGGNTVPYRYSIGLATSSDGVAFTRAHSGPVLDRMHAEPHLSTSPWVRIEEGAWRMWYTAGLGWEVVDGRPEPRYHIRCTDSADGVSWRRPGRVCLDLCGPAEAGIGRPSVLFADNRYRMWCSVRGNRGYRLRCADSYRMGYAESRDGIEWSRQDALAGIAASAEGWDSDMIEYSCVHPHGTKLYLFYNGNGFGRSGFGYAGAGRADL